MSEKESGDHSLPGKLHDGPKDQIDDQQKAGNLQGMIGRNEGLIKEAELATVVDSFYVKGKDIGNETSAVVTIKNDIQKKFNSLSETNPDYLNKKYTVKDLIILIFVFTSDVEVNKYDELINYLSSKKINSSYYTFNRGYVRKKVINELNNALAEWRR